MLTQIVESSYHTAGVSSIAFTPLGVIVSTSLDGTVVMWDPATARGSDPSARWKMGRGNTDDDEDGVNCGVVGAGGTAAAVGMECGAVWMVDFRAPAPTCLAQSGAEQDAVNALLWTSDTTLLSGTDSGAVILYDIRAPGEVLKQLETGTMAEVACLTRCGGSDVWVGGGGGALQRVAVGAGGSALEIVATLTDYDIGVNVVAGVPWLSSSLVVCSGVLCHERHTLDEEMTVVRTYGGGDDGIGGHSDYPRCVTFVTPARQMYTAGDDGRVFLWALDGEGSGEDRTVAPLGQMTISSESVMAMAYTADGAGGGILATGAEDTKVTVWKCAN